MGRAPLGRQLCEGGLYFGDVLLRKRLFETISVSREAELEGGSRVALLEAMHLRLRGVGAGAGAADDEFCRRLICGAVDGSLASVFAMRQLPELVWGRAAQPRRTIVAHLAAEARTELPVVVVQAVGAVWAAPSAVEWYPENSSIPGAIVLITELLAKGGVLFFLDDDDEQQGSLFKAGADDHGGRGHGGKLPAQMAKNAILRDAVSLVGALRDKEVDAFARETSALKGIAAGSRPARLAARLMMLRAVYPLGPMVLLTGVDASVSVAAGVMSRLTVTSQTPFVGLVAGVGQGPTVRRSAPALARLAMEGGVLGEQAVNRVKDAAVANIEAMIKARKSDRELLIVRKGEIEHWE